jgi:HEAT repeat protein
MDEVERLLERFRTQPHDFAAEDHLGDPRVVPFLVALAADPDAYDLARIEAMKVLCLWPPDEPLAAGRVMAAVLRDDEDEMVRQYAAMSLGPYAADDAVLDALAAAVLGDDDVDVRHNALSAVVEAGPDERTVALLSRLASADDTLLGRSAARTLREWDAADGPA